MQIVFGSHILSSFASQIRMNATVIPDFDSQTIGR